MSSSPAPASTGRLVFVLGLAGFSTALTTRALDPLLIGVAADFSTSIEHVALLASAYALPYALIQPLLGPVGDALGKRRIILLCCVLLTLSLLACAGAPGLGFLFLARIAAGATSGGVTPLALASFGDAVPLAQRQVAMSRFLAWAIGGQVAGGVLAGLIGGAVGWRGMMLLCALASLTAALVLWRDGAAAPEPQARRLDPGLALQRYREILRNPAAPPLYIGVAIEGALTFGVFPFLAALLERRGIGGIVEAGLALGVFGLGGFAYAALAGRLVAGIGQARMLILGGILAGAGLTLLAAAGHVGLVILATFVTGLGYFMMHNSIQVRVTELSPTARGSAVALHAFSFFLGQSLGPILFGMAQQAIGAAPSLLASAGGMVVLGFWLGSRRPARGV
ncbi:MFS transporter [Roseomonas sp. OT10]|uniref:MFS transporter n=1 Tax=Roseomonas cutis TaxID=2897332 RepID=UPI001E5D9100|nr:MFS transporter [Roseomonas sp. OT10]UFN47214.1 MFS transporter [Roseomonas sp. OT10]